MATRNSTLTAAEIRRVLDFDPETGVFTWRHRDDRGRAWNTRYAGQQAGTIRRHSPTRSYLQINVGGRVHYAHRLAWLWVHGAWPPAGMDIDHVNGDGRDNRLVNLRVATRSQNLANRDSQEGSTCRYKGVSFDPGRGKYAASIKVMGRVRHLGRFDTPEDARDAYAAAARESFGAFARTEGGAKAAAK